MQRHLLRSARLATLVAGALGATLFASSDADAQVSGTSSRPLPDVLLLVDTSGSMERMVDGTVPPTCTPGTAQPANRWGLLVQALTGNIQPYYSCLEVPRATGSDFTYRYGINGKPPYDHDYALDYHQPVSGSSTTACATIPYMLPGAASGSGVGVNHYGSGGNAYDYPDTALASVYTSTLVAGTGVHRQGISVSPVPNTDTCTFQQGFDGQLDATKYYARFALMTFDNDPSGLLGTTDTTLSAINTADPFTGQWSFIRDTTALYYGTSSNDNTLGAQGKPGTVPACPTTTPQEVGARNIAAPPWEGRLINFPSSDATVYEMDTQNTQIQNTLIASRPYGATPIDGMFDDARDYYWNHAGGPKDDAYSCRDRYIILLTDGAPNLDLRPSCAQPNGVCPYPDTAGTIASTMRLATNPTQHVITYVIGFAVTGSTLDTQTGAAGEGTGFPASVPALNQNCKDWFDLTATAAGATDALSQANAMSAQCTGTPPLAGSTADACCKLNDIALQGGQTGAFFAQSQADITLAFGKILANIIHSASTKTTPVFSPATQFSNGGTASYGMTTASAGEFIASYIPSSQVPWSGEIDRTRYICDNTNTSSPVTPESSSNGDFESENLAVQSGTSSRLFITVLGDKSAAAIDSQASIRPFSNGGTPSSTGGDTLGSPTGSGVKVYAGTETYMNNYAGGLHPTTLAATQTDWPLALNVTQYTCQRGRGVLRGTGTLGSDGTAIIPALDDPTNGPIECSDVVWGFLTADPNPLSLTGDPSTAPAYNFNVRCQGNTALLGFCSITGGGCDTTNPLCPTGESCVPKCAALGAIYHSTPAILPAPQSLLREEGFRSYQQYRAARMPVLYAASTDGILHAFKALLQASPSSNFELWSFVPPAVLPTLSSNYPAGNQVLLDGAPIVRETVWDRVSGRTTFASDWHATLVAGLGTFGGYYAVNVTDADCAGNTNNCLSGTGSYGPPAEGVAGDVAVSGDTTVTGPKHGPHFLWQITDAPSVGVATETAITHRTSPINSQAMVPLFGKNTGTPAVGMVDIKDSSGVDHQVGIAILPGGYETPPVVGGSCPRKTKASTLVYADQPVRTNVRQWATDCLTKPVPGRGVTIVRLDNGEIIKHFGRKTQDVPTNIQANTIDTAFDSPMTGVPVVYPDQVGVPIQKIFIGDADGTLWRIDLTNTDPTQWSANLFEDLIGAANSSAAAATLSEPINVAPVVSTDDAGNLVVNVATGDQESIVVSADQNYLYSIREVRDTTTFLPKAQLAWYKAFLPAERVTGPMVVFDKTLYFATFYPTHPTTSSCDGLGTAKIWGLDYVTPQGATPATGGAFKWCHTTDVSATTGLCTTAFVDEDTAGTDIIPGVSLQTSQACTTDTTDAYGNTAFQSVTSSSYSLTYGIAKPNTGSGTPPQAARNSIKRALPATQARIDSWSIVVD